MAPPFLYPELVVLKGVVVPIVVEAAAGGRTGQAQYVFATEKNGEFNCFTMVYQQPEADPTSWI